MECESPFIFIVYRNCLRVKSARISRLLGPLFRARIRSLPSLGQSNSSESATGAFHDQKLIILAQLMLFIIPSFPQGGMHPMPRGDKSKYTAKQKRQAEHIEESYESRGVPEKEAERRAWATENKISGGGRKGGSGRPQSQENKEPYEKGGHKGGESTASRPQSARSASANKAAATRTHHRQH